MRWSQKGFTMVELAVVLVVISLMTLGVLKVQALIENTKISNLIKEFEYYEDAVYIHTITYRRAPGFIMTGKDGFYSDWKKERFWKDLREAGLIEGDPSDGTSPVHSFGDPAKDTFIISRDLSNGFGTDTPFVLCAKNIKKEYAQMIDQRIDDGDTSFGSGKVYLWNGRLCKVFGIGRRG